MRSCWTSTVSSPRRTPRTSSFVRHGALETPHTHACLPGVTRATVIEAAREDGLPVAEKNLSLTEVYTADEMFTTGTAGALTPVLEVDGRRIGSGSRGALTVRLQELHREWAYEHGEPIG